MRHPDVRTSLLLLAIFAALLGYTFTIPRPRLTVGVGPAFVPQVVLIALIALTLILLFQAWLRLRAEGAPERGRETGRRHLLGMGLAVALVLVMDYAGTFLAIGLYTASMVALAGGRRRPWLVIAMGVGVPLAVFLLFTEFLEVQFPAEWAF